MKMAPNQARTPQTTFSTTRSLLPALIAVLNSRFNITKQRIILRIRNRPMRAKFTSINLVVAGCLVMLASTLSAAANITVTNTADSGPGTLRAALASAGDGDTID